MPKPIPCNLNLITQVILTIPRFTDHKDMSHGLCIKNKSSHLKATLEQAISYL